ncbi:hypothetical protein MCHI_000843 [Candidatus Magnetoovum chiemensis]|nr:hypothetical protein MCHI_000843 [Candidatus Magnetoovum chiemensis]
MGGIESMLYNIATTDNDDQFNECLKSIGKAYYDEERYRKDYGLYVYNNITSAKEEDRPRTLQTLLKEITTKRRNDTTDGLYIQYNGNNNSQQKTFPIPFVERFHRFFLERHWYQPKCLCN